jgi:hypothetical protein
VSLEGKALVTFKVLGETRTKEEKVVKEECYVLGKNIRKRFVSTESLLAHFCSSGRLFMLSWLICTQAVAEKERSRPILFLY